MKGQYLYNSFLKQISTDFRRGWDALPRILTHKTNFIASYGTIDFFLGILLKKLLNYNSISMLCIFRLKSCNLYLKLPFFHYKYSFKYRSNKMVILETSEDRTIKLLLIQSSIKYNLITIAVQYDIKKLKESSIV